MSEPKELLIMPPDHLINNLPPRYIDDSIQVDDRKLLEIYYTAEWSEGGSADEVILRGIKAVLAHSSQQAPVAWCRSDDFNDAAKKRQSFSGWREKLPDCDMALYVYPIKVTTDFRALCAEVIAYNEGQGKYNFTNLKSHERDNAAFDAWVNLRDEIKAALAATTNDQS